VSENLDLVRSIYTDWERGDFSRADWADSDIAFVICGGPAPGSWRGPVEMARAWRDYLSTWEDYRAALDTYREIDDDRTLVLGRRRAGRAKASGVDAAHLDQRTALLFEVHDGKVTRLVLYSDRARALADLGLEE
jgi:ketosteroid isomerase-like protein